MADPTRLTGWCQCGQPVTVIFTETTWRFQHSANPEHSIGGVRDGNLLKAPEGSDWPNGVAVSWTVSATHNLIEGPWIDAVHQRMQPA